MSFIQCKDTREIEKILHDGKIKAAFVTEDNRIYTEIELSDNQMFYRFEAETAMRLYDLQSNIEMLGEDGCEQSFLQLEKSAKSLIEDFKKVMLLIKSKPIKKASAIGVNGG